MKKRKLPKSQTKNQIRREKDPIPWRYCLLTIVCGVFLAGGFFLAARSHFSSIDFGFKNSGLKRKIDDLESEKRRLTLLKEIALSPGEIKKAAKKLGLTGPAASSFETVRAIDGKFDKTLTSNVSQEKTTQPAAKNLSAIKTVEKTGKDGVAKDITQTLKQETRVRLSTQIAKK